MAYHLSVSSIFTFLVATVHTRAHTHTHTHARTHTHTLHWLALSRMERELVCLLVCVAVTVGQTFPYFSHSPISGTTTFTNRTFIDRGIISIINPLKCLTSHTPCCVGAGGGWVDPEGTTVQVEATGATTFYVSTNEGEINLHRFATTDGDQLSGMYECQIPGPTGVMESVFIYLGVDGTGEGGR